MPNMLKKIPPEIMKEIFGSLSQKDIANVRLVCNEWMEISSPLYINTLAIFLQEGSLQTLNLVTEHRLFRKGIRTLNVDLGQYQQDLAEGRRNYARAIFNELLKEVANGNREKLELTEGVRRWRDFPMLPAQQRLELASRYAEGDNGLDMITQGWWQYTQMFRRQQAVLKRTDLLRLFNHALAQMPGIKNLIFSHLGGSRRSVTENGGTDSSRPYCLAPAIEENMSSPPHLVDFFEAWNQAGKPLNIFNCVATSVYLPAIGKPLTPTSLNIFRNTRRMAIVYGSELIDWVRATREKEAHIIRQGYTGQLLAAATLVENLCISGAVNVFFTTLPVTLYPIIGNMSWAHLTILSLSTVEITFHELETLCDNQMNTLEVLLILRAGLFGGTWASALPVICRLRKLRDVVLTGLWHGKNVHKLIVNENSKQAVQKYVLEGGPNPLEPAPPPSA